MKEGFLPERRGGWEKDVMEATGSWTAEGSGGLGERERERHIAAPALIHTLCVCVCVSVCVCVCVCGGGEARDWGSRCVYGSGRNMLLYF